MSPDPKGKHRMKATISGNPVVVVTWCGLEMRLTNEMVGWWTDQTGCQECLRLSGYLEEANEQ